MDKPQIPDKLYFKIGEVSRIIGVKPYVLRYWESEFGMVRPQKSKIGQRVYRRREVETILRLKTLLYDEKYTIAGAKIKLAQEAGQAGNAEMSDEQMQRLVDVINCQKQEIRNLIQILAKSAIPS